MMVRLRTFEKSRVLFFLSHFSETSDLFGKPRKYSYIAEPMTTFLEIKGKYVKIYINGLLHLMFDQQSFIGFQSWKEAKNWFSIEIYLKDREILCAYDDKEKWAQILKLLDENL